MNDYSKILVKVIFTLFENISALFLLFYFIWPDFVSFRFVSQNSISRWYDDITCSKIFTPKTEIWNFYQSHSAYTGNCWNSPRRKGWENNQVSNVLQSNCQRSECFTTWWYSTHQTWRTNQRTTMEKRIYCSEISISFTRCWSGWQTLLKKLCTPKTCRKTA